MANRLIAWGPAAAWAALLFLLSSLSDPPGPEALPYGDKLAHFIAYAVLGVLLGFGRERSHAPHLLLLALGALYGVTDEWHQSFVPGRVPDWADWLADAAGLLTGYTAFVRARAARMLTKDTRGTA